MKGLVCVCSRRCLQFVPVVDAHKRALTELTALLTTRHPDVITSGMLQYSVRVR